VVSLFGPLCIAAVRSRGYGMGGWLAGGLAAEPSIWRRDRCCEQCHCDLLLCPTTAHAVWERHGYCTPHYAQHAAVTTEWFIVSRRSGKTLHAQTDS